MQCVLGLTHTVAGTATETVEIEFIAQLGFKLREFHFLYLDLHPTVGELCLDVGLQLGGLLAAYLKFIESFGVVHLGRLEVKSQQGCTHIHAVAAVGIDL